MWDRPQRNLGSLAPLATVTVEAMSHSLPTRTQLAPGLLVSLRGDKHVGAETDKKG